MNLRSMLQSARDLFSREAEEAMREADLDTQARHVISRRYFFLGAACTVTGAIIRQPQFLFRFPASPAGTYRTFTLYAAGARVATGQLVALVENKVYPAREARELKAMFGSHPPIEIKVTV